MFINAYNKNPARIWTQLADSIFRVYNRYATYTHTSSRPVSICEMYFLFFSFFFFFYTPVSYLSFIFIYLTIFKFFSFVVVFAVIVVVWFGKGKVGLTFLNPVWWMSRLKASQYQSIRWKALNNGQSAKWEWREKMDEWRENRRSEIDENVIDKPRNKSQIKNVIKINSEKQTRNLKGKSKK